MLLAAAAAINAESEGRVSLRLWLNEARAERVPDVAGEPVRSAASGNTAGRSPAKGEERNGAWAKSENSRFLYARQYGEVRVTFWPEGDLQQLGSVDGEASLHEQDHLQEMLNWGHCWPCLHTRWA